MKDKPKRHRLTAASMDGEDSQPTQDRVFQRISYLEGAYESLATREDVRETELRIHTWLLTIALSVLGVIAAVVSSFALVSRYLL